VRTARDTPVVVVTGLLFLLSGGAALVYQVAWQRLLALHSGVGLYSVAMIVAAFMAGLGVGSLLGGRLSTRFGARRALVAFASLEVAIGAFGAASTYLYYDWLYPYAVHLPSPSWQAGMLHLAALLPPTVLMGMSLPFLVRAVVTDVARAGRRIGWLYGINVLGAAIGALATPWLLLPRLGLRGAVLAAAGANLIVGALAVLLALVRKGAESDGPGDTAASRAATASPVAVASPAPPGVETPGSRPLTLWLSL
jgi:spermidine synthase